MKARIVAALGLLISLTAVSPAWAQEMSTLSTSGEDSTPLRLSDYPMQLNTELGYSAFEYVGNQSGKSVSKLSGGLTVDFGSGPRLLETGLMVLETGRQVLGEQVTSTYLALPMAAKLRLLNHPAQSWYAKFGFTSAFELGSNRNDLTNDLDVLLVAGLTAKLRFTREADLILDATYNRGTLDALRADGRTFNQGFLFLAGLSFKI
jgi:hypothetical protein